MNLHEITKAAGANKRPKRVGRGESSGLGKTSGRGHKGCKSRSGGGTRRMSQGAQLPIFRRLPKRGFNNYNFRTEYELVNLCDLEQCFDNGATVDHDALIKAGLIHSPEALIKILGKGQLTKKLSISAHAASKGAKDAIEKAGGSLSLIEVLDRAAAWKAKRRTVVLAKLAAHPDAAKKSAKPKGAAEAPKAEAPAPESDSKPQATKSKPETTGDSAE
jgi:large subunit ribosomal protein L15